MCLLFEYNAHKDVRCNMRKEIIGRDTSKVKVLHKDKISGYDPSKGKLTY